MRYPGKLFQRRIFNQSRSDLFQRRNKQLAIILFRDPVHLSVGVFSFAYGHALTRGAVRETIQSRGIYTGCEMVLIRFQFLFIFLFN